MTTQQIGPPQDFLDFADRLAKQVSGGQARLNTNDPESPQRLLSFVDQRAQQFEQETGRPRQEALAQLTSAIQGNQQQPEASGSRGGLGGVLDFATRSLIDEDVLISADDANKSNQDGPPMLIKDSTLVDVYHSTTLKREMGW